MIPQKVVLTITADRYEWTVLGSEDEELGLEPQEIAKRSYVRKPGFGSKAEQKGPILNEIPNNPKLAEAIEFEDPHNIMRALKKGN